MSAIDPQIIKELRELQSGGTSDFLAELIDLFLRDLALHLENMRKGLAAKDGALLLRTSHTVKGSSGNLGARGLSAIAARLHAAVQAQDWAAAATLVAEVEREAGAVDSELKAEKDRPGIAPSGQ